jgi:hypothetical protein
MTCGWQRREYGSWTFSQFSCDWDTCCVAEQIAIGGRGVDLPFWPRAA